MTSQNDAPSGIVVPIISGTTDGKNYEASTTNEEEEQSLERSIDALITTWTQCISELQQLQVAAESSRTGPIRGLNSLLRVQQRALDKVIQKKNATVNSDTGVGISAAQYFGMKSCCWEDKWKLLKKCRGLVSINKEFPRSPRLPVGEGEGWLAYKDQRFQEKTISVDAVVDSGTTWLKFVSISPRTLSYQVVTEGWDSGDEFSDDEDGDNGANGDKDSGLGNTEFAEGIRKIILAARWNHCHHLHLVLPSLKEGQSDVVDRMLKYVRGSMGGSDVKVTISCEGSPFLEDAPPPLEEAIAALVGGRDGLVGEDCGTITETVNLDPSALTAIVTDLHHGPVALQPISQQRIITRSVLDHETDNNELVSRQDILAHVLYPALSGRKLVCTQFAAKYFRQLIEAISTHSEEVRASLILPSSANAGMSSADIRQELQKWSNVPIPEDLNLPVEIVEDITLEQVDGLIASGKLPPIAAGVAKDLSRLNRSVYLYGWANDITTITGHRGIERQIQLSLATHYYTAATTRPDEKNERPPDVWHRHLGGYLIHRDKPKNWRDMLAEDGGANGAEVEVPKEVIRWTNAWTTWGRGISTYGLPDTKTWDGVGHEEKQSYGRRMSRREKREKEGLEADGDEIEEEEEEQD
ncbi:Protein of unknown function (DUF1308) domain containing protein [Naviculisporaceae sp. PSN 640]